jgi:transposase InsO family protein
MYQRAIEMYVDGMNLRRIARHLGVHHRTVSLWVRVRAEQLPDPPVAGEVKELKMDELFTFIGEKKTIYIFTIVDRTTRCYLGFKVVWGRTQPAAQEMVDEASKARRCYSDAFDAYERLWYHEGIYEVSQGKTDTYSVEGEPPTLMFFR